MGDPLYDDSQPFALIISGGIDSPVAAWRLLKRGLHVDHVYFHAFPYTGDKVLEKVLTIARGLGRWTPNVLRVFVASTTKIQDAIAAETAGATSA